MITTFESVKFRATKTGKCICGKKINRSKTFEQTINPWNKNKDGLPKNRFEILEELRIEAKKWQDKPIVHSEFESGEYYSLTKEERERYERGEIVKYKMSCGFEAEYQKILS